MTADAFDSFRWFRGWVAGRNENDEAGCGSRGGSYSEVGFMKMLLGENLGTSRLRQMGADTQKKTRKKNEPRGPLQKERLSLSFR